MSIAIMILGESGTGKSTSLRNLDPNKTALIQSVRKPLPFRSAAWKPYVTDDPVKIEKAMRGTARDVIVIDDFQYVLANEFMRRSDEKGYDKFTQIAKHAWDILRAASDLAAHRRVYILCHTANDDSGHTKMKTIGRMLDEKITPEGMVTIVLRTQVRDGNYLFATQNSGSDTSKSPLEMFSDFYIPNDLAAVDAAIVDYYGLTQPIAA